MYQCILLALDGSPASNAALQEAARLARDGARLHVVTVVEDPFLGFAHPHGIQYDLDAVRKAVMVAGQNTLHEAQARLTALGIKADPHLVEIPHSTDFTVPEAILKLADTCQADLIILGTHGRKGFKRILLGSIAEHIARASIRPVLLVRAP